MIKSIFWLSLLTTILVSCNQKDIRPSWVTIDKFDFTTNEILQGPASSNITDVWVYMDGDALGVFELPCKFPVIDEGEHTFILFPGVKENGISSTRTRYAMYESHEEIVTLVKDDTVNISPSSTYKTSAQFAFIEDFEDAGISLIKGPISDTDITFITKDEYPDIVEYGDKCGGIFLTTEDSLYSGSSVSALELPKANTKVYLEFDFKSNNVLTTGVIARYPDGTTNTHTPLVDALPQKKGEESWRRIYINLTLDVSSELNAASYEFYFISQLFNNSDGQVYLDNIKVVHL